MREVRRRGVCWTGVCGEAHTEEVYIGKVCTCIPGRCIQERYIPRSCTPDRVLWISFALAALSTYQEMEDLLGKAPPCKHGSL